MRGYRLAIAMTAPMVVAVALAGCAQQADPAAVTSSAAARPAATPTTPHPTQATPAATSSADLAAAYAAAVADASGAEVDEEVGDLVALTPDSDFLKVSDDGKDVLMATWTNWDGYAKSVGKPMTTTRDVWVTPVPQLAEFCRSVTAVDADSDALELRLEQYLGLPTDAGETGVAELWVPFDGLFRPAGDPQIDDTTASAELAPADPAYPDHTDWYRLQQSLAYDPQNPYPWTRLGYTYDWGNTANEEGASEFVVRIGTEVEVDSVTPTDEYCR